MKTGWPDIKKKYKIYSTRKYNQIKRSYSSPQEFENAVLYDTYFMLIVFLEKNFKNADELAIEINPNLRISLERCIWVCQMLLKKNESEGNTVINASNLAKMLYNSFPELMPFIKEAVNNKMFSIMNISIRKNTSYTNAYIILSILSFCVICRRRFTFIFHRF